MEFDTYQARTRTTAVYPGLGDGNITYTALGLCGESGEVAEKIKKILRDKGGIVGPEEKELLKKELGDVLWYVAALCAEIGLSMDEVAAHNLQKLADRKARGKIHGDGDVR